jgi:hypothetical protein
MQFPCIWSGNSIWGNLLELIANEEVFKRADVMLRHLSPFNKEIKWNIWCKEREEDMETALLHVQTKHRTRTEKINTHFNAFLSFSASIIS